MAKKIPLTPAQKADAERLKAIYHAKARSLGLTQDLIADELGITQGGVSHYLNGKNALNTKVAATFARLLRVSVGDFSPSLEAEIDSHYTRNRNPDEAALLEKIENFSPANKAELLAYAELIEKRNSGKF